jgi:hypothetical protein
MAIEPDPRKILGQATPPGFPSVLVIGHEARQVTVYSQQIRALKLIWALNEQRSLAENAEKPENHIVVVGGGVAGVTAAAAAMLYGAHVTILERNEELLHLQRGCHTRYLHPRIYEWPSKIARYAGAGLPILDWSVGTASEVAERMLADFHRIRLNLNKQDCLKVITSVRDVSLSVDGRSISWLQTPQDRPGEKEPRTLKPRAIVLALGFGIERTVNRLPRRSYWRVDSLTQTALDSDDQDYRVLAAGTGDGAIIDVLRAKLKNFDHGGFLDECVLRFDEFEDEKGNVRQQFDQIERDAPGMGDDSAISVWLDEQYERIEHLKRADGLLESIRPQTQVTWIGPTLKPLNLKSQRLNRVLAWRLCKLGHVKYQQGYLDSVEVLDQESAEGCRYKAHVKPVGAEAQALEPNSGGVPFQVHQIVARIGSYSPLQRWHEALYEALKALPAAEQEGELNSFIRHAYEKRYKSLFAGGACRPVLTRMLL